VISKPLGSNILGVLLGIYLSGWNIWCPAWGRGESVHMVSTRNMASNGLEVQATENN